LFVFEGGVLLLPAIISLLLIDAVSGLSRPSTKIPRHVA
jgi:hypothetical protein